MYEHILDPRTAVETARAMRDRFAVWATPLLPRWYTDAPDEEKRARSARILIALMQTPLLANFIGWWSALWLATTLVNEFYINGAVSARVIVPHVRTDPARSNRNWALLIVWGSAIYSWGWVFAWLKAGPAVSFLAAFWLTTAAIQGLTYFSNQRDQFLACISMGAIACLVVPLTFPSDGLPAWCVLLGVSQFLLIVFLSFRDRHQLIRAVIRSRAEGRAAKQSNVAKSQFMATMSHELRTPLNAVIGYAELLQEDLVARGLADSATDAARISRAANNLLSMINEILDLSKIEAGKLDIMPTDTNVPVLLQEVGEMVAHLIRDNDNAFVLEIAPGVGHHMLDGKRVRQCALNLIANACKFTTNGNVTVRAALEGDQLRIDVIDTGCGIAADKQAALFEPFVQVDQSTTRKHGGTGLGLAITRRLARLMGGDVALVSAENRGSTFTLLLPATAQAAPPEAQAA